MPLRFNLPDDNAKKKVASIKNGGEFKKTSSVNRKYSNSTTESMPITKSAQFAGSGASVTMTQPMFFSPLHTPQNWQIASKRREMAQWARFYYENEPKVAAGIDFYAQFPMNGFKLECKSKKVLKIFEKLVKDLKLNHWLKLISHEYYLLGDVFPFTEIDCKHCGSTGFTKDGEPCNHPDGTIKKVMVLNPDWIEVKKSVLAGEPVIVLVPDDELRSIVSTKSPIQIYEKLPKKLVDLILSGQPIHLSNRSVSHIKHNECPYADYGTSLIRRLFTVLAYKTKLMTANWIVAERLILPIRVVKVGDKDRPAQADDIADVSNQLSAVANDPNLTIVTHHAFDYEYYGATGKIHNITQELEYVGKEILDGLMLNQALLNGEASSYSSAQVGVETLLRRLDSWRSTLAEWVENRIFLPVAMMKGLIDEKESKDLGETVYLYPKLKWNDLNLRDNSNHLQMMMQLQQQSLISIQKLLEEFDIDYDQEVQRLREEQMAAPPMGGVAGPGGMGGLGGLGGGLGGGGGGGPPMPPMPGGPTGGPEGAPGGPGGPTGGPEGMGATPPGGDMGAAGMGASASLPPNFKITKKGRGGKSMKDQMNNVPPPTFIKLTKLEQKMYKILQGINSPYQLFGQYQVKVANQSQPFLIDFAFPAVGVAVEADGAAWHETAEAITRDKMRDNILANYGWRVLRFKEEAIQENPQEVAKIIHQHIEDAKNQKMKKSSEDNNSEKIIKEAAFNFENIPTENLAIYRAPLDNDMGEIFYIGIK